MLAHVGTMLGICWPLLGHVGPCWGYARLLLALCWVYMLLLLLEDVVVVVVVVVAVVVAVVGVVVVV